MSRGLRTECMMEEDEGMNQNYEYGAPMGQGRKSNEHDIILKGRKQLKITGVKQVESFDNEEFLLETMMGFLAIRGQGLHMKNLDVEEGVVSIEGKIYDFVYLEQNQQDKSKGFFLGSYLSESYRTILYNDINGGNRSMDWNGARHVWTLFKKKVILSLGTGLLRLPVLVNAGPYCFFYVLLQVNNGEVRLYIFLALLCGYAAYRAIFQNIYRGLLERLIQAILAIYRFITRCLYILIVQPIKLILKLLYSFCMILLTAVLAILRFFWKPLYWLLNTAYRISGVERLIKKSMPFFSKNKGISSVDEEKEGVEVIVKMNVKRTSTIRELDSAYKVQREQELELQRRKRRGLLRRLGALGIFALTLCTIATVTIVNQVSVLAEKEQEKVALQEELQALEKESNHLKQEIINYNNDEYVSEVARRDYYLSAEGETLFKLPESAAD